MRVNLRLYTSKEQYMRAEPTMEYTNIPVVMIGSWVDAFMLEYELTSREMVSHVEILSDEDVAALGAAEIREWETELDHEKRLAPVTAEAECCSHGYPLVEGQKCLDDALFEGATAEVASVIPIGPRRRRKALEKVLGPEAP